MTVHKIEISSKTIIFTIFFFLFMGFLWQIRELIFSLFIAFIIAGALRPAVDFFEKNRIPRKLSAFFVYFLFVFLIINLFALILPPLINEIISLFKTLPSVIERSFSNYLPVINLDFLTQNLPGFASRSFEFIKGFFSNAIFVTTTLFFGFYFLVEKHLASKLFGNFFEEKEIDRIEIISERAQKRMSSWFWGEVVLMIIVGSLTYLGLLLIGMKYSLALAVLAGLLEVIPNLGPILSAIPAAIIGLSHSPLLALYNVGLYFIVQQLENNLIVPVIMRKATGLHPIITLIALIVGGKLAGILGVLLAVPVTIFIETVIIEVQKTMK